MRKQKVLFLCTQNSTEPDGEGFLRHLAGDRFEAYSAGMIPHPRYTLVPWRP